MDSFTRMGETILLAAEGQQQIARALFEAVSRGIRRLAKRATGKMPETLYPQD
jgi:hypothetical protein